jgi:hypothetical protein
MSEAFDYEIFGLRVRSEVALPELTSPATVGAPDVVIRLGMVPEPELVGGLQFDGEALVLTIPGAGRYRIEAGREIVVDPDSSAPERNARLYLLGSAFGALLHQRGLLPLHASAIAIDGSAVAFMGESGSGKSTLAAWFQHKGCRVLADDVCVVKFDQEGRPAVVPGPPRLRLWEETLEAFGGNADGLDRSYAAETDWNKFDVPITEGTADLRELPLRSVYVLQRGAFAISQLQGLDAAEAVFAHTYRGQFVSAVRGERGHWAATIRLVQGTPVYQLSRSWGLDRLDDEGARIIAHADSPAHAQVAPDETSG